MVSLFFGRLISTVLDGFSSQYFIGLLLELSLMILGVYNLKEYSSKY